MTNRTQQDFCWMIGGPQGSGVNSTAEIYAKVLTRLGYHVFGNIEYHSNIKGKHSYFQVRAADYPIRTHREKIDLLVALDEETLFGDFYKHYPSHWGHAHRVKSGGTIIYDSSELGEAADRLDEYDVQKFGFSFVELLNEALESVGKGGQGKKYSIMSNTVAYGASMGLLDIDFHVVERSILDQFMGKKRVGEMNVLVARHAYEYARDAIGQNFQPIFESPGLQSQIMIKGTQAVGIAKIKAGVGFQSYYPISPATDESVYLEEHQQDYLVNVLQTEDEVSAINMAVSAAHGGVRASTSTSGPGFSLMPEGIGFAAMTESPGPVVCLYQRGGPSTGIPTRTEQGDLRKAIHAAHGDYPSIVLAPGDIDEYFYDTYEIFNLCDRYQVPATILYDKYLASGYMSTQPFDDSELTIDRGPRFQSGIEQYERYELNGSPVSPRSIPGEEGGIFWTSSDEHQQDGHISEGIGNRMAMQQKRMSKLHLILDEYPADEQVKVFGNPEGKAALITWGSNKGPFLDALEYSEIELFRDLRLIQIRLLHPFPANRLLHTLQDAKSIFVAEQNYTAQLAGLIQENIDVRVSSRLLKYDGRPFSYEEAVLGIEAAITNPQHRIIIAENGIRDESTWGLEEMRRLEKEKAARPTQRPTSVPLPPNYNR